MPDAITLLATNDEYTSNMLGLARYSTITESEYTKYSRTCGTTIASETSWGAALNDSTDLFFFLLENLFFGSALGSGGRARGRGCLIIY